MKPKALILTNGILSTPNAKTAHGLIRGTDRFDIAAVIDFAHAGEDAGAVLDGTSRGIPVFADIPDALAQVPEARFLVIGIATPGGVLPEDMLEVLKTAIRHKLSIVNGLHDYLSDRPDIAALAQEEGVELLDIRRPKKRSEMAFWNGDIYRVECPIVAVLGMDCAMGKRTTARLLRESCERRGRRAQMIYTGQTGWLQGGKYGFIFDSTLNDFVSGELEHAIVRCWEETGPEVIFIEGQSSLRNPSGPCGSELIISGNAKRVVLMHAPKRSYYDHEPHWGLIPPVASEIAIIRLLGAEVIAVCLHTEGCTEAEALQYQQHYEATLAIPVVLPLTEGVDRILPLIFSS